MFANELVLASGSPRRQELLKLLDRPFSVVVPNVPEERAANESATSYVQRLALTKARAGAELAQPNSLVLGADTIVVCDDEVLEKPRNFEHFVVMMKRLSGRSHFAITAVAAVLGAKEKVVISQAEVTFKELSDEDIDHYWQSGEPQDKAGGYGIQGRASKFVTHLNGSYFAVVGLPMYETEHLIQTIEGRV
ncbi:Maf family nucleotide pyrophosphatase [Pseudidiomarina marina]|uniref:Maf family protein n=1 Tax=Pseudidiomarina marina TaxID=502366 RepID=UPI00384F9F26